MRWKFGGGRTRWPNPVVSLFPPARPDRHVDGDALRVTMVGHASLLIQVAGLNILTDPVWSERVSPFTFVGPKRVVEPGIRFDDLPPIDLVLVIPQSLRPSRSRDAETAAREHAPHILTPLGNDTIIHRASIPTPGFRHGLGRSHRDHGRGDRSTAEPCHHWSARGTGDRRMALWAAFVITTPAGKIYHIGDTGFHDGVNYRGGRGKSTAASASPSCLSAPTSRAGS